jgi:hypothetical protein
MSKSTQPKAKTPDTIELCELAGELVAMAERLEKLANQVRLAQERAEPPR